MMMMYTRPEDGGVSIVTAVDKEAIERVLGPMTQEQYEAHVIEQSIPKDAINIKRIAYEDLPTDREFRNAWVDVTDDSKVNIDLAKAKAIKLEELRQERNKLLDAVDKELLKALDLGGDIGAIRTEKQRLRDLTEPLKTLVVDGVDDPAVLEQIKKLAVITPQE